MSNMIAGIYIPPEEKNTVQDCRTCKWLYAPMYNGPCKDCINNGSLLGKTEPVDRWEAADTEKET